MTAVGDPANMLAERIRSRNPIYYTHGMLLTALLLYPEDERRRNQFVTAIEPVRQRLLEPSRASRRQPSFFELFGGVEELGELAREFIIPEAKAITEREWPRAGRLLRTVVNIHRDERTAGLRGGASLEKAYRALGAVPPRYQRSTLVRAWQDYANVAHLLAAIDYLVEETSALLGEDLHAFEIDASLMAPDAVFLVALGFQRFGLQHRSGGRATPVLSPQTLWRIPDAPALADVPVLFKRLTAEQVEALL